MSSWDWDLLLVTRQLSPLTSQASAVETDPLFSSLKKTPKLTVIKDLEFKAMDCMSSNKWHWINLMFGFVEPSISGIM